MPPTSAGRFFTLRRLVAAVVVLAVAALLAWAFQPAPLPVEIARVTPGPLEVTLDEEGETRVRDRFVVSAPVTGRVLRIELEPGDPVQANRTRLATFQPVSPALLDVRTRAELNARVQAADAALERARAMAQQAAAEQAQAERTLRRTRELVQGGASPPTDLELAETAARSQREAAEAAEAAVRSAEAERRAVRAQLTPVDRPASVTGPAIPLVSPIDGVVLKRLHESEAVVPQGEPLLEVGDVSRLEIVADYLSADAVRIRPGQRVIVERWGGGDALGGRVRRVEPSGFTKISALGVEEQRVNVIVDLDAAREAWAQLGDRYRVEVRVVISSAARVLRVPVSALVRHGEAWSVFAVDGGRAVSRTVTIGARNDAFAEVRSGLAEGAAVVAFPGDRIADGVAVSARAP
jgi:HlyD family secretion protein